MKEIKGGAERGKENENKRRRKSGKWGKGGNYRVNELSLF